MQLLVNTFIVVILRWSSVKDLIITLSGNHGKHFILVRYWFDHGILYQKFNMCIILLNQIPQRYRFCDVIKLVLRYLTKILHNLKHYVDVLSFYSQGEHIFLVIVIEEMHSFLEIPNYSAFCHYCDSMMQSWPVERINCKLFEWFNPVCRQHVINWCKRIW